MQPSSRESIEKRLIEELATILGRELQADDVARPLHELGVDSMSLVELLVAVEKEFGIRLLELGVTSADLQTVRNLAAAIHREG